MNGSIDNYNGITMKYHEMQFEKLANHAIRIEFPNSTNAIRPAERLGMKMWGDVNPCAPLAIYFGKY